MKKIITIMVLSLVLTGCQNKLREYGNHYQKHHDHGSLQKVVGLIEVGIDTSEVKKILGDPINFGFDYRYTTDLKGENGCIIGAVFHIDSTGKIDQKWFGEICE
ncbi:hypothetical protein CYCD_19290 [Tenuifilaceae bacterium CYCD]|nr:hypothetical protein CYCD_19290 [Tenuifilaceae bacterium CYCD]